MKIGDKVVTPRGTGFIKSIYSNHVFVWLDGHSIFPGMFTANEIKVVS